jgi:tetratricopeptide (TPR) repeat protein
MLLNAVLAEKGRLTMYKKARLILLLSLLSLGPAPSAFAGVLATQTSDGGTAYLNQALAFYNQGEYKEAVEAFTQAIRLKGGMVSITKSPEWKEAIYKLGIAHSILGDHRWAMTIFSAVIINQQGDEAKQVIRLDTENPHAHYDLGTAYYISAGRQGLHDFSLEAAAESFRRAIKLKSDYAEAYWYLGMSLDGLHRFEEAIDAHNQAIQLDPDNAETYNSLGLAHYALKRYPEAIEAFNKSISLKPGFVAPQYHLGMTHIAVGDRRSAVKQYNILKKLSPEQAKEFRYLLNESK